MSDCTCPPNGRAPSYCPIHWPAYTVKAIEAAAIATNTIKDVLGGDRETIATDAVNTLAELLLPHVPAPYRAQLQKLWTQFAPVAVKRAVVQTPSLTVVDERTPGAPSSVELVDERGSNPTADPSSTAP